MPITTPFKSVHEQFGATFAEYDGWEMPVDFGNIDAETKALAENCIAYDLSSFGRIVISGGSAAKLMDKVLTSKLSKVFDGQWVWAIICDKNSEIIDTVKVAKDDGKFTVFCSPGKRNDVFSAFFNQNSESDNKVEDITENTGLLALYGPESFEIIRKVLPFDISGMEIGSIRSFSFFMMNITVVRGGWTGTEGIEIICPKSACGMAAAAVGRYRDRENIVAGGMESLKTAISGAKMPFSIVDGLDGKVIEPV